MARSSFSFHIVLVMANVAKLKVSLKKGSAISPQHVNFISTYAPLKLSPSPMVRVLNTWGSFWGPTFSYSSPILKIMSCSQQETRSVAPAIHSLWGSQIFPSSFDRESYLQQAPSSSHHSPSVLDFWPHSPGFHPPLVHHQADPPHRGYSLYGRWRYLHGIQFYLPIL